MVDDLDNYIRLFESNTIITPATSKRKLGICILTGVVSAKVTEEINGSYEVELEYDQNDRWFDELKEERILLLRTEPYYNKLTDRNPQAFRIYSIEKPINAVAVIKAQHISYDLSLYPVQKIDSDIYRTLGETIAYVGDILNGSSAYYPFYTCPFEFEVLQDDQSVKLQIDSKTPRSAKSLIGDGDSSLLGLYSSDTTAIANGNRYEMEYDNYQVNIHTNGRGENSGVVVRYGSNLTELKNQATSENKYTHVYTFYRTTYDVTETKEDGTEQTKEEEIWQDLIPDGSNNKRLAFYKTTDNSPDIDDETAYRKVYIYDCTSDWQNVHEYQDKELPSKEELEDLTKKLIKDNKMGDISVELDISFELLSQYEGLEWLADLEKVHIGDKVQVIAEDIGVNTVAEVMSYEYNPITNKYNSIKLGEIQNGIQASLTSTSNSGLTVSSNQAIEQRATKQYVASYVTKELSLFEQKHEFVDITVACNYDDDPNNYLHIPFEPNKVTEYMVRIWNTNSYHFEYLLVDRNRVTKLAGDTNEIAVSSGDLVWSHDCSGFYYQVLRKTLM